MQFASSFQSPLFVISMLLVADSIAHAQYANIDWPHLRGSNYDAISSETGLVTSWTEKGPPILWTRDLGQGYSGFTAADGKLFTQYQTRTGLFVAALDPRTGADVWSTRVDWPWQPAGAYPGPYATPTYRANRLYYSTPTGTVGCLNAADGGTIWSINVREKFQGKGTDFGYAITPLVEDGRVIVPVGGPGASLVALNANDGSTLWKAGDDAASYCPAYPIMFRGRRLVVAFLQNSLAAHDPATGQRVWRQRLSSHYDEHSAWPLYAEPHLLTASPFRVGAQLYRLEAMGDDIAAKPLWSGKQLSNDVCSSVLLNGHVFGFDLHQAQSSPHRASRGLFKCLDFLTGKVRWETKDVGQASVLVAGGKLILLDEKGDLVLARANPAAYEEMARAKILNGGLCWTPPMLWNGRLYARNHTRAVCVYLRPPETLDATQTTVSAIPQTAAFDWTRLVPREPDFPNDAPIVRELTLWFGCSLGLFVIAAVVAVIVRCLRGPAWAMAVFTLVAALGGLLGTTLVGLWADAFILTWPVALYVALRATLAVAVWAERNRTGWRAGWLARGVMALFIALCYGYYRLCLSVGYAMAWGYLAGFLIAIPSAVIAARSKRTWLRWVADIVGFTVYFWASGLFPAAKNYWSE